MNYLINVILIVASVLISVLTLINNPGRFLVAYLLALVFSIGITILTGNAEPVLSIVLMVVIVKYMYTKISLYFGITMLSYLLAIFILTKDHQIWPFLDLSIGLGIMLGLVSDKESMGWVMKNTASKGRNRSREITRDLVQVGGGIALIILLMLFGPGKTRIAYTVALVVLIIIGAYVSMNREKAFSSKIYGLERNGVPLGIGAIWFGCGIMLAYAIINSINVIILILIAVTICDPLATIIGMRIKSPRIFYNKKKSIAGTISFLVIAGFFGFVLLNWSGLFLGVLGAFIESLPYEAFDDNFMIPVVLSIVSFFIF